MITKTRGHSATVASAFGALCSILRRRRQRHSSSGVIATSVPPLLLLRRHSSSDVIATLLSTAASVPLLLLLRRHCCYDGVTYRRYCDFNTTASVQPRVVNYGHQQPCPPLSFQQQVSSVDALFHSADQTFGIVSLLI